MSAAAKVEGRRDEPFLAIPKGLQLDSQRKESLAGSPTGTWDQQEEMHFSSD